MLVDEDERPLGAHRNPVSSAAPLIDTAQTQCITIQTGQCNGNQSGEVFCQDRRLFGRFCRVAKRTGRREETFEGDFLS